MSRCKNIRYAKLGRALKKCRDGKLVLIKGTEDSYLVSQALRNGLCVYCNIKNVFCGPLEPPLCAMQDKNNKWWDGESAELYVRYLACMLDSYSPAGWHFHIPIFGIVLEWGWFRSFYFKNHLRKEI